MGMKGEVYGPGTAADKLRPVVEKAISRGYPAIVLCAGNGDTLKADTPHFMAAYGYDEAGVTLYDPWDGVARAFSWAAFEDLQLFAQAYVPLRRRDAQLSAW
jgi:predicted GNAT superfamily acetyltransferase